MCFSNVSSTISPILLLLLHFITSQCQLQSTMRITKTANCNITGLKWLMENITVQYRYPKTYFNGQYPVIEEIKGLTKVNLHIERCNDRGYDCEDFQNWRIDRFCRMLTWKNQVWTEAINQIHPPLRCPIKKVVYELRNVSLDMDAFINWFPNVVKYRWRGTCKLMDERDAVVFCGIMEAYLYQFRIQDRKSSRKPRN